MFGCFAHAYHKALGQGLFRVVGGEIRGKSKYHLKFVHKVTIYTHELAKFFNFDYVFGYSLWGYKVERDTENIDLIWYLCTNPWS